jgi:hypothetical protein
MFRLKLNTIVAVTALAVAVLGSTPIGHAAARFVVPKNSIGATQIKKNAVTGLKVKDGTLVAADFKAGQLPVGPQGPKGDTGAAGAQGLKGEAGAQGPKGETGSTGAAGVKGDKGDPGATKVVQHTADGVAVAPGSFSAAFAYCGAGETVVGGGGEAITTGTAKPTLSHSRPYGTNAWGVWFRNDGATGFVTATAYALCTAP